MKTTSKKTTSKPATPTEPPPPPVDIEELHAVALNVDDSAEVLGETLDALEVTIQRLEFGTSLSARPEAKQIRKAISVLREQRTCIALSADRLAKLAGIERDEEEEEPADAAN